MGLWVGFLGGFYQPSLAGVTGSPSPEPPSNGQKTIIVAIVAATLYFTGRTLL